MDERGQNTLCRFRHYLFYNYFCFQNNNNNNNNVFIIQFRAHAGGILLIIREETRNAIYNSPSPEPSRS